MPGALIILLAMLAANAEPCPAQSTSHSNDLRVEIGGDVHPGAGVNTPTLRPNLANTALSGEDSAAENELLEAANKSRELAGASQLKLDDSLRQAARAHAQRMVESGQLEHQFPSERPLLERIAEASSLRLDRVGENIANAANARSANEVLMNSPPHRENLLDRGFNVAGFAAIWRNGRLYVVQDFAHQVPSYSTEQSGALVGRAVAEMRKQEGLPKLIQLSPPKLDEAACSLAEENRPNARLLATAYDNSKIVAYTESRPDALPQAALRLLRDPQLRQFAVGSCYARNAAYPTGMYWVAILLY
ncbi:MAG: CAP domain-containing protein [Terriglobales bacterium]|jgi:uncharacterized protein YkwD